MASIVKRKNRYSVVYTYKDDDGNQHQKWETFDTNADAKKRKTQIEFEQQSGTFIFLMLRQLRICLKNTAPCTE